MNYENLGPTATCLLFSFLSGMIAYAEKSIPLAIISVALILLAVAMPVLDHMWRANARKEMKKISGGKDGNRHY